LVCRFVGLFVCLFVCGLFVVCGLLFVVCLLGRLIWCLSVCYSVTRTLNGNAPRSRMLQLLAAVDKDVAAFERGTGEWCSL
jgi:hypothetical protein